MIFCQKIYQQIRTDLNYNYAFNVVCKTLSAANALWNNLIEPVGRKSTNWLKEFDRFLCPTDEFPFIRTWKNSMTWLVSTIKVQIYIIIIRYQLWLQRVCELKTYLILIRKSLCIHCILKHHFLIRSYI